MRYEEFRDLWMRTIRESGLERFGFPRETLDVRSMDRVFEIRVEPVGGQDAEPFTTTARLAWRWEALQSARTATTEQDLLMSLLGTDALDEVAMEPPTLRVDVALTARLPYGDGYPMASTTRWSTWAAEVVERLRTIEPLVSPEWSRPTLDGRREILAWQSPPRVDAECSLNGELVLRGLEIEAFQFVALARQLDGGDLETDDLAAQQIALLLERVRAALHAWQESLDAFRP